MIWTIDFCPKQPAAAMTHIGCALQRQEIAWQATETHSVSCSYQPFAACRDCTFVMHVSLALASKTQARTVHRLLCIGAESTLCITAVGQELAVHHAQSEET